MWKYKLSSLYYKLFEVIIDNNNNLFKMVIIQFTLLKIIIY